MKPLIRFAATLALLIAGPVFAQTPGVSATTLRIGAVMGLEDILGEIGRGLKAGIEAALVNQTVQGRQIEFVALNDSYDPPTTVKQTQALIEQGVFAVVGYTGTPTAIAALPLLVENDVPTLGFYTGADFSTAGFNVYQFRANYTQELTQQLDALLAAGIAPTEICAFVQDDAYGAIGLRVLREVLARYPEAATQVQKLDAILAIKDGSDRNGLGPVGLYERNTLVSRVAYNSLKAWENASGTPCRLIFTVGTYSATGNFIGYAHYKGESWLYAVPSPAGGNNLKALLAQHKVTERVVVTQVTPALDRDLPIVTEARAALGQSLDYLTLEGYIIGRLLLESLRRIEGELTRENFRRALDGQRFDLGGLALDFSTGTQGGRAVTFTYFDGTDYRVIEPAELTRFVQQSK